MGKNNREKEMLYQWAKVNDKSFCFQEIDKSKESYYGKRNYGEESGQYIREYAIESLPDIMKELDILWSTDEIMCQVKKIVGVAVLKNKPLNQEELKEKHKKDLNDKLPVFIYNF